VGTFRDAGNAFRREDDDVALPDGCFKIRRRCSDASCAAPPILDAKKGNGFVREEQRIDKANWLVVDGATGISKGYAQPVVDEEVQDDVVPGQAHPGVIADEEDRPFAYLIDGEVFRRDHLCTEIVLRDGPQVFFETTQGISTILHGNEP
jgi:hypothetical protein